MTEIQKKREMFGDACWNQTLKPRNKMLDVSLKKIILNEQPVVRSGITIWNLRKISKKNGNASISDEDDD